MNRLQCSYPVSRTQFGQRSQVPGGLTCQLHEDVKMSSEWLESRHHGRSAYVPVRLKSMNSGAILSCLSLQAFL